MKPKRRRTLETYSDIVKTYMVDPLLAKDLIAVCVSSSNKFRTFQQEVQRYNMCSTKSTINLDIWANDFRNIKFFYILLKDLIKQLHLIINHYFATFEGFSILFP